MMQQVESVFSLDKARPTASPTSVLEDDPCCAFMADWSWEASNTPLPPVSSSSSQAGTTSSPICSSPLRSSSSSEEAMQQQKNSSKTSRSLVETLQNCLTSLPQSTATMSEPSSTRPQPPSRPAGKRRPRASRRTPTKTIETEPGEFKDMVQKLTGIVPTTPAAAPKAPAATAGGAPGVVPVRPRPQRANSIGPQTLRSIRRLPPMGPPPPPLLPLSRLRPSSDPIQALRSCKREFDQIDSGSTAPKRVMSAPLPSLLPSWCWDQDDESNQAAFAAMSTCSEPSPSSYSAIDCQARENLMNVSAIGEEQEFNFDPMLTSWLSGVDCSSTSSPCAF